MTQEIHITVPKGAKVVIHEEGEPEVEVERSLEERLKDLLDVLEAQQERMTWPVVVPVPYVVPAPYPVPTVAPYRLVPPYYVGDLPGWLSPTITYISGTATTHNDGYSVRAQ